MGTDVSQNKILKKKNLKKFSNIEINFPLNMIDRKAYKIYEGN